MNPIAHVHVLAMGFTQSWRERTGQEKLWRKMRALSSPHSLVMTPFQWDRDPVEVARFIAANTHPSAFIKVYAYSWGCGQFFVELAQRLAECGRGVDHAVLCDPVYRNRIMPTWFPLNPSSLWPHKTLRIPSNVSRVTWFYQRQNKPSGHTPEAIDNGLTRVDPGIELEVPHDEMDEHPVYQACALDVANGIYCRLRNIGRGRGL